MAQSENHIPDGNITDGSRHIGDTFDIESLFLRYSHLLYLVCHKYLKNEEESKDAVMEIFLKLLTVKKEYSVANLPAWLHTVTKNHCLMKIRGAHKGKIYYMPPDEIDSFVMENDDFGHRTDGVPIQWSTLLDGLNKEQKACIEMFYFKKKSYKEIARLNTMDINEVKSHLQNGKRNLKKLLEKAETSHA